MRPLNGEESQKAETISNSTDDLSYPVERTFPPYCLEHRERYTKGRVTPIEGYLLLSRALDAGALTLDDSVEPLIPEIGPGFRGRTVGDVASMAVNHSVAELAACTGDETAKAMFDRDERMIGLQRNDQRETLRQFVTAIGPGAGGSTLWTGEIANYATINTSVLGLALEHATKTPLATHVRDLLHEIGAENTVYMGTDFEGVPIIGASLISATLDFARYGRLLAQHPEQVERDRVASLTDGQPVPAVLTHVESRYYRSAIHNEFGIGHSGWGGQLLWADPAGETIVAINSVLASALPAPVRPLREALPRSHRHRHALPSRTPTALDSDTDSTRQPASSHAVVFMSAARRRSWAPGTGRSRVVRCGGVRRFRHLRCHR